MKHLGDITKIDGAKIPAVDVVTGGSPCQDLSVAGKRSGMSKTCPNCGWSAVGNTEESVCPECGTELEYTRSGLFMEQIRVMKEMREHDRRAGRSGIDVRCRYGIWENVPGALSSNKGADFQAVLTEFARVSVPNAPPVPMPDGGKWPKSGVFYDSMGRFSIAYRIHDAQYWGVPQRRRRLALVADFNGLTAAEILFDPQLRRETEDSEPDQAVADSGAQPRSEVQPLSESVSRNFESSEAQGQGTATATESGTGSSSISFQERAGKPGGGKGILIQEERTGALSTLNIQSVLAGEAIPIEGNGQRESHRGNGYGNEGDPMFTLNSTEHHAVASSCLNPWDVQSKHIQTPDGVAESLYAGECRYGGGESYVMDGVEASGLVSKGNGEAFLTPEKNMSLGCGGGQAGQGYPAVVTTAFTQNQREEVRDLDGVAGSVSAESGSHQQTYVAQEAYGICSYGSNAMKSPNPNSGFYKADTSRTLDLNGGSPACNQGGVAVVEGILPFDTTQVTSPYNGNNPHYGDPCHPLAAGAHPPSVVCLNDQGGSVMGVSEDVTGALRAQEHGHQPLIASAGFSFGQSAKARSIGFQEEVSPTLRGGEGGNQKPCVLDATSAVDVYNGTVDGDIAATLTAASDGANHSGPKVMATAMSGDISGTLDASYYKGCGERQGVEREVVVTMNPRPQSMVCQHDMAATLGADDYKEPQMVCHRADSRLCFENHGQDTRFTGPIDVGQTVSATYGMGGNNQPFVVEPTVYTALVTEPEQSLMTMQAIGEYKETGAASALKQRDYKDATDLVVSGTFQNTGQGWWNESDVGATVRTPCGGDSTKANLVAAVDCRNATENPEVNGTLQAKEQGQNLNSNNVVRTAIPTSVVRRLTPTECCALQGFYPDWVEIGEWTDSKGKVHKDADSPKYKALGNSIAVGAANRQSGFWIWLARRICAQYERQITMGSLFSGIGGFELSFVIAGAKPVFASEVESFPIAVCKKHFGDEDAGIEGDVWNYLRR